jgi:hypothetical protein
MEGGAAVKATLILKLQTDLQSRRLLLIHDSTTVRTAPTLRQGQNQILYIDIPGKNALIGAHMNSITNLSAQQLRNAAALKEKIQALEKELNQLLGSTAATSVVAAPKKKFKMSAAARAKISAAAKARWAKVKGTKPAASPAPKKARRKMSAAARAKISAAAKARWAKVKAAQK